MLFHSLFRFPSSPVRHGQLKLLGHLTGYGDIFFRPSHQIVKKTKL